MSKRNALLALAFLAAALVVWVFATQFRFGPQDIVGEATTVLTEPLTENGLVDYARSHNQNGLELAPASKNVVAQIWTYSDVFVEDDEYTEKFAKALGGNQADRSKFQPFVSPLESVLESLGVNSEDELEGKDLWDFNKLKRRAELPWRKQSFPVASKSIDEQSDVYEAVAKFSKLPFYFHPLIAEGSSEGDGCLMACLLPVTELLFEFSKAFRIKAMLHIGEGETRKAIECAKTIRNLGRLVCQGATPIERMLGDQILSIAVSVEHQLLRSRKLDPAQLADYQDFLGSQDLSANVLVQIVGFDRKMMLDIAQRLNLYGVDTFYENSIANQGKASSNLFLRSLNFRTVLKEINHFYDEIDRIAKLTDWQERRRRVAGVYENLENSGFPKLAASEALLSKQGRSRYLANILIYHLFADAKFLLDAGVKSSLERDLMRVAFASERFRLKNESYPTRLDDLVPDYLAVNPTDRLNQKPFSYRTTSQGFVVYSFGYDGEDDGGHQKDDICVEIGSD